MIIKRRHKKRFGPRNKENLPGGNRHEIIIIIVFTSVRKFPNSFRCPCTMSDTRRVYRNACRDSKRTRCVRVRSARIPCPRRSLTVSSARRRTTCNRRTGAGCTCVSWPAGSSCRTACGSPSPWPVRGSSTRAASAGPSCRTCANTRATRPAAMRSRHPWPVPTVRPRQPPTAWDTVRKSGTVARPPVYRARRTVRPSATYPRYSGIAPVDVGALCRTSRCTVTGTTKSEYTVTLKQFDYSVRQTVYTTVVTFCHATELFTFQKYGTRFPMLIIFDKLSARYKRV